MAGKYAEVIPKLPRYENPDRSYQDKINERKRELIESVDPVYSADETDDALIIEAQSQLQKGLSHLNSALRIINTALKGRQTPAIVGRFYKEIRIMKDLMAEQEFDVNLSIAAFEALLVDIYDREDLSNVRMTTGGSVGVQWEPYAKVVDREAHRQWAVKEGLERSMTLPWQTTNALTKDRLIKGQPAPPGIEATSKPKVVLRKA